MDLMETVATVADRIARPLLYVRDRDELPDRDLKRLADRPSVVVLRRRELENYLLDAHAITRVLIAKGGGKVAIGAADVAVAMRKAADGFKVRVVRSRALQAANCLERITPVAWRERDQLLDITLQDDRFIDLLVKMAGDKLTSRLQSLEPCIRQTLKDEDSIVAGAWEENWQDIVPGADVLATIFESYGGYSKKVDGPAIAAAMDVPPEELRTVVGDFLVRKANRRALGAGPE
jgi:hypothetical protein